MTVTTAVRLRRALMMAMTFVVCLSFAPRASAHPLGNFTTNTSTLLTLGEEHVALDYVIDFAEIPALQMRQRIDHSRDGELSATERAGFLRRQCRDVGEALRLTLDGTEQTLAGSSRSLRLRPGQAGLHTLRVTCEWSVTRPRDEGLSALRLRDGNFEDRPGWREIVAATDGATIESSDALTSSPTQRLTAYPQERLASPLHQRSVTIRFRPGVAKTPALDPTTSVPASADRLQSSFFELIARQRLTPLFGLLAMALALTLGATHAFAPGHGKTLMAAFLLSREGTARQALGLGLTVAATHTLGVLLLGVVIATTEAVSPVSLYPWLGVLSGLCFAGVGVWLLRRARRRRHTHHHHAPRPPIPLPVGAGAQAMVATPTHGQRAVTPRQATMPAPTWRSLALPGLAGGLTPSPSALVVLLSGVALDRTWYAVLLVVAYGLGMAATLVTAGWFLLRASHRLQRLTVGREGGRLAAHVARLPVATAAIVIAGGAVLALRSGFDLFAS